MKLIYIRHLPTEWNEKGLLQGRRNINILPVSETYKKGILNNKVKLKKYGNFDLILVSSLKRTQQTAALYGIKNPVIEPLLNEVNFGYYEGRSKIIFTKDWEKEWKNNPEAIIFNKNLSPGSSIRDLKLRIEKFLNKYNNYNQLLVFGHGAWVRGFITIINRESMKNMNLKANTLKNNQLKEMNI